MSYNQKITFQCNQCSWKDNLSKLYDAKCPECGSKCFAVYDYLCKCGAENTDNQEICYLCKKRIGERDRDAMSAAFKKATRGE